MEFPFDELCYSLGMIKNRKINSQKIIKLKELVNLYRQKAGNDCFPLFRLLLPSFDRERNSYGLKEQILAKIFVSVLGIDPKSPDATGLISYKQPKAGAKWIGQYPDTGKFMERLEILFQKRMPERPLLTLSLTELHAKLDELANVNTLDERIAIFRYFYVSCTLIELLWLTKIILKFLDLGLSERTILPCLHPDAYAYYQINCNLKLVCSNLKDPQVRFTKKLELRIFCPFAPMLSKRIDSASAIPKLMENNEFWIETKLDGERMQMHMEKGKFRWWSRNSTEYTSMYGSDAFSGSLVPFIHKYFKNGVESVILDGEMMSYDKKLKQYGLFGSLKTASKETTGNSHSDLYPCFVVFDVLLLNGKSLLEEKLSKRRSWLEKLVVSKDETRLNIQRHTVSKTEADVMAELEIHIANNEEGLIMKNPNSFYVPNAKESSWLKLKPEYIGNLQDDMDLVIVGGYYGTGRRGGCLASFLCAVKDNESGRFISFCKFGNGYSMEELPNISLEEAGKWNFFDRNKKPEWLELPDSKDWPDKLLHPSESHIVQVRGSQLVKSTSFPTGITIRFPRFIALRSEEKSVDQALTFSELKEYFERHEGRMQLQNEDVQNTAVGKKKKQKTGRTRSVASGFVGVDSECITKRGNLFSGIEFCVMIKEQQEEGKLSKQAIEELIVANGGEITQTPVQKTSYLPGTKMIIADLFITKVTNQKGRFDIIRSNYILDCIERQKILPLITRYCLWATKETSAQYKEFSDKYGDSYTDEINVEILRGIFAKMEATSLLSVGLWAPGPLLDQYLASKTVVAGIRQELEMDSLLFSNCIIYIADNPLLAVDDQLEIRKPENEGWNRKYRVVPETFGFIGRNLLADIRLHGGTVIDCITTYTTHVVCLCSESLKNSSLLMSRYPHGSKVSRVVSHQWISHSISNQRLLDESKFAAIF